MNDRKLRLPRSSTATPRLACILRGLANTEGGVLSGVQTPAPTRCSRAPPKIAVLFYNALRHGMNYVDPGDSYCETRYRRAGYLQPSPLGKVFGFVLQAHLSAPEPICISPPNSAATRL